MFEECPHGGDPYSCPPCNKEEKPQAMVDPQLLTTTAKFQSRCEACGGTIEEGDKIVMLDDEWVCNDCVPQL